MRSTPDSGEGYRASEDVKWTRLVGQPEREPGYGVPRSRGYGYERLGEGTKGLRSAPGGTKLTCSIVHGLDVVGMRVDLDPEPVSYMLGPLVHHRGDDQLAGGLSSVALFVKCCLPLEGVHVRFAH